MSFFYTFNVSLCFMYMYIYIYMYVFYIKYNKIIINKNTKKFLKKFQIK